MKKLFSLLIVFISIKCLGQVYQVLPQYGYEMKRVNATLVLLLPSDTVTNKTGVARIGTVLYSGNGTKWTPATATDTTSLSNRINLKVNISDTAAMLSNYAKTSAVNLKVNISDTAAMLTNYAKTSVVNSGLALKVNISDTATMLSPYAKTSVVNSGLALKVNISDTAAMLANYAKTSAVNSGLALKVNISDTATMLTPYLRKIDTASLSNRINLKVNISDTAAMLTNYLRKIDTASLSNRINLKANINNATFTGTFATAAGAIGNASLANGAVANLSGTNTGDQTTITGNAGTATALQTARTIGTTTGDATSAGSSFDGTANNTNALTLATVNSNVGTFTNSTITVNGKGLITAASSGTGVGTVTSVAALTLGTSGTDLSSTVANSTTTPVITLNVPTASATNRGALSSADWTTFNGKESVLTFSSPLVRTTNTISIPAATTSVNGYLSSTDWTTFNSKQATITLTTTGTSGAATFSANTLNIPQYQGVITNPVTGTGTTNYVPKFTSSTAISNSVIYASATNVGISNTSPLNKLHITQGTDTDYPTLGTGKGALFIAGDNNLFGLYIGINTSDGNSYMQVMRNNAATAYNLILQPVGGSVGIGTTTPAASSLLDVTSTTKGFLPPRMTTTQINAISSPAAGLVVYNTTLAVLCFYDGTAWKKVSHSAM